MAATYAVLARRVTIDSSNNSIRFREGGSTSTVTVAAADYVVGSAAAISDLVEAVRAALQSHAGANTYSSALELSADPASPTATVTFSRATGANTFQILWGDGATTFDGRLLGFVGNTVEDANPKVSARPPTGLWVSNAVLKSIEEVPAYERRSGRATSRKMYAVQNAPTAFDRIWEQEWVDERRLRASANAASLVANAFEEFVEEVAAAGSFEFHECAPTSGEILEDPSTGTLVGEFHLSDDFYPGDSDRFANRHSDGLPLYSWMGRLLQYVP